MKMNIGTKWLSGTVYTKIFRVFWHVKLDQVEEGKSLKWCMVLSFVYVILMNGSLKHDTKATDGGGLALTLCTEGIRESWRGRLTAKKWILLWAGVRGIKTGFEGNAKYFFFSLIALIFEWVDSVFSHLKATYGKPSFICSWLLAPQLPGINMLKGWQLNFPLWLLR